MRISEVIRRKGTAVVTVAPEESIADLVGLLYDKRIGAVVVTSDGATVTGIVGERDVLRALHERGPDVLRDDVASIMTSSVHTCVPDDDLESVAGTMTDHRVRHLPVVEDEKLVAIVSIGDVVKHRLDELTDERNQLVHYVHGDRSTV